jgi:hypothetical protein
MKIGRIPDTPKQVPIPGSFSQAASPPLAAAEGRPLNVQDIANHPRLVPSVRQQAKTLLSIHAVNPRIAAIFATQQRWLMAHVALAHSFKSKSEGNAGAAYASNFIDAIVFHRVASRNTADAFLKEMRKYGYLQNAVAGRDRRIRPIEPTAISIESVSAWLAAHLTTLDALDGGDRRAAFLARPQSIVAIQPLIAERLLQSAAIRAPAPAFSLFTWLNEGGIVMDWLIAGLADVSPGGERLLSTVSSFADLGERINLSRTHLIRKLRMAEAMGSLGWIGERGKSAMWVSADFALEYHSQQSVKLAIIDNAFHAAFAG